jgi:hypothetical protein
VEGAVEGKGEGEDGRAERVGASEGGEEREMVI